MKNLTKDGRKILKYFSKSYFAKRPNDEEYDALIKESVSGLFGLALQAVHLDKEDCISRPVIIYGPPNFKKLNGLEFKIKKRKDNHIRFIPLGITIYNFTNHSLMAYQCNFDPTTRNPLNVGTFEYFYNDIVSFETFTESGSTTFHSWWERFLRRIPILRALVRTGYKMQYDYKQRFILTTSGGTNLPVTLTESVLRDVTNGGEFPLSKAHKSISVVRRIIRDKKSYTLGSD